MKRLPLASLLLLCAAGACDNIADITPPTMPTPTDPAPNDPPIVEPPIVEPPIIEPAEPDHPPLVPTDPEPTPEPDEPAPLPEPPVEVEPPTTEPPVLVPSDTWARCAVEGGECAYQGAAEVRYGADSRFRVRAGPGPVSCDNAAFGGDPIVGVVKACDMRLVQAVPAEPPVTPEDPPTPISPHDPTTLLVEWQPRFAALGFRLQIGPRQPHSSIARPEEHRWEVALYDVEAGDVRLYYAVFAPAIGDAEAMSTATALIEYYHAWAQDRPAERTP